MRGERATLGKSLLDVQRNLRIKVSYISAIENCDAEAFDTPGFIPGYVRSYAKYLGMDPDEVYDKFCKESGYSVSYGISSSSTVRSSTLPTAFEKPISGINENLSLKSSAVLSPAKEGAFEQIEARAIASIAVLAVLISGLCYGGWSVLKEIQKVQLTPIEVAPFAMAEMASLTTSFSQSSEPGSETFSDKRAFEKIDRLYSPKALDFPILNSRKVSIAMLDVDNYGNFKPKQTSLNTVSEDKENETDFEVMHTVGETKILKPVVPQVSEILPPSIALFVIRDAWVSVKTSDGTRIFEKTMKAGDEFILPNTESAPKLHAGMSGSIYFVIDGELYGPAGSGTKVIKNISLSKNALIDSYKKADLETDPELIQVATTSKASSFTISKVSD